MILMAFRTWKKKKIITWLSTGPQASVMPFVLEENI